MTDPTNDTATLRDDTAPQPATEAATPPTEPAEASAPPDNKMSQPQLASMLEQLIDIMRQLVPSLPPGMQQAFSGAVDAAQTGTPPTEPPFTTEQVTRVDRVMRAGRELGIAQGIINTLGAVFVDGGAAAVFRVMDTVERTLILEEDFDDEAFEDDDRPDFAPWVKTGLSLMGPLLGALRMLADSGNTYAEGVLESVEPYAVGIAAGLQGEENRADLRHGNYSAVAESVLSELRKAAETRAAREEARATKIQQNIESMLHPVSARPAPANTDAAPAPSADPDEYIPL